jgi:hypothetical protein
MLYVACDLVDIGFSHFFYLWIRFRQCLLELGKAAYKRNFKPNEVVDCDKTGYYKGQSIIEASKIADTIQYSVNWSFDSFNLRAKSYG